MTVDWVSRCISTAIAYREDCLEHDVDQDVLDRHHQRVPEQLVLEELGEVVEADEVRCAEQVVLGQAEVEAADERVEVEHQEPDGGGQDEDQRHAQIAAARWSVSAPHSGLVISCNERALLCRWSCACSFTTRTLMS